MPTENTSLKNITPTGDSNTTHEMVIGKSNTNHRTFVIVAGSLLVLFVLIAAAGTSGGQHLQSSAHEIVEGDVALADYQVDSTNLAQTKDIFGLSAIANDACPETCCGGLKQYCGFGCQCHKCGAPCVCGHANSQFPC